MIVHPKLEYQEELYLHQERELYIKVSIMYACQQAITEQHICMSHYITYLNMQVCNIWVIYIVDVVRILICDYN